MGGYGGRGAGRGGAKNKIINEDVLGGIRDITPHLIHDSKGSTPSTCVVFHEESHGYDPRSIYPSYDFLLFEARVSLDPEGGRAGPGGQKMRFIRFDPMLLRIFLMVIP